MKKILIVDDEMAIREGLKALVKNTNKFKIVGVCKNGKEALEVASNKLPDIVITDIKMPVMDGFDFISNCRKLKNVPKFIILSGYDDFEYARKAFRLEVCDYLLKPIDISELLEKLDNISSEIEKEKKSSELIKKQLGLLSIQKPNTSIPLVKELLGNHDLKITNCQVILISIKNYSGIELVRKRDIEKSIDRFINEKKRKIENVVFLDNKYIVIILFNTKLTETYLNNLIKSIENINNLSIIVGIGNSYSQTDNIYNSYKEATLALLSSIYSYNKVINFKEEWSMSDNDVFYIKEKDKFKNAIQNLSIDHAKEQVDLLFADLCNNLVNPNLILEFLDDIYKMLIRIIYGNEDYVPLLDLSIDNIRSRIFDEFLKVDNLKEQLYTNIKHIIRFLNNKANEKSGQLIDDIIIYIKNNYNEEITLELICSKFFIDASYFCRLFKKKTGITFNQYLTDVRINKAKELLMHKNLKINEISKMVGYKNPKYFAKIFRDVTNKTPTEYRIVKCRVI